METRRFLFGLSITASLVFAAFSSTTPATAADDSTRKPKDDGYRGIWFALGQYSNGTWRIVGLTERGPQRWGGGGEVAVWTSGDQGKTWT